MLVLEGMVGQVALDSEAVEHRVVGGYLVQTGAQSSVVLLVQHLGDGEIHEMAFDDLTFNRESHACRHADANVRLADHFAPIPRVG